MSGDAPGDDFLRAFEQGFAVGELIRLHDEILAFAQWRGMNQKNPTLAREVK